MCRDLDNESVYKHKENYTEKEGELSLTIHCQHGRLSGLSGIIGGHAGVVPRMTSPHRLNAQHADALTVASDDNAIVGEDPPTVLGPGNV